MSGSSQTSRSQVSLRQLTAELATGLPRGFSLLVLDRVDSTNRLGRSLASRLDSKYDPHVVILALEQRRGRGRAERSWVSPRCGGVWLTWVGPIEAGLLPTLPSRVGVTLCRRLERIGVTGVGLKWPNDIVVGRRKLGGILCRSFVRGERTLATCGVGVNILNPGGDLTQSAVGLKELGVDTGLAVVAGECIRGLDAATRGGSSDEAEPWRDLLDRYSVHRPGDEIAWHGAAGSSQVGERRRGTFRGFDGAGRMRVEVEGREELLASGEIV